MIPKLNKGDSLINAVVDLIDSEDVDLAARFDRSFENIDRSQEEEVRVLNQFLRRELGKLPVNTISERECLIDDIDPSDWLKYFKSQVLKTVLRFKIPRPA